MSLQRKSSFNSTIQTIRKRAAGIEPASSAWKAEVLPLNYARVLEEPFQVKGDSFVNTLHIMTTRYPQKKD